MKKIISLIVETRESDCPQYNYRNWKEVAEHNYEHKKYQCFVCLASYKMFNI